MNPNLESALNTLCKEAKKVLVEYNNAEGIIFLCMPQSDENRSSQNVVGSECITADNDYEYMKTRAVIATKREKFFNGLLFSLAVGDNRTFKYVESKHPGIESTIFETNHKYGGFDEYCQVSGMRYEDMLLRLNFLNGIIFEQVIRFQDLNFFDEK